MEQSGVCKCHHHKIVPLVIVLIGLAFLLQALGILDMMTVAIAWPVLLIVAGLAKLSGRKCGCCKHMGGQM